MKITELSAIEMAYALGAVFFLILGWLTLESGEVKGVCDLLFACVWAYMLKIRS